MGMGGWCGRMDCAPRGWRRSAPDSRHRPGRLEEAGLVDAVARELGGDRTPPQFGQFLVGSPASHRVAQVALVLREQAVADLAVRGQPDPVTLPAERPGDRAYDAYLRGPAIHQERLRRRRAPGR